MIPNDITQVDSLALYDAVKSSQNGQKEHAWVERYFHFFFSKVDK